jgi:hypothetical protein
MALQPSMTFLKVSHDWCWPELRISVRLVGWKRAVCKARALTTVDFAGRTAAVEQQLALTAEQHVGLPAVDGEAAGAESRAGVERHGQQLSRVHDG